MKRQNEQIDTDVQEAVAVCVCVCVCLCALVCLCVCMLEGISDCWQILWPMSRGCCRVWRYVI